jgi:uncharacterized protein YjdB
MRTAILAVAGLAFGATACSSGGTSTVVERNPVAAVSVSLPSPSIVAGQTAQAVATPRDASGVPLPDRPIVWQSSSSVIASVSAAGLVSALLPGSAIISATSEGVRGESSLTVMAPAPVAVANVSVTLSPSSLVVGQTANATATLRDAGGNDLTGRAVAWSSSNAGVASVNSSGVVTALSAGSTNIVATSEGQNGLAALTVSAPPPPAPVPVASVSVSPTAPSLTVGGTIQLSATTRDANGNVLTGRTVTWTSSNAGIASVNSSGLVTAVSAGSASISAFSEGQTGSSTVTVTAPAPVPVASVSVSPTAPSLPVGGTIQLSAVTRDASGNVLTGRTIVWSSSNAGVASVTSAGGVTATGVGTANITATSEGRTGTSTVTVTLAPVASVTVSPATASISVGQTQQLSVTLRDGAGTVLSGRTTTWRSNSTSIATVSASGLVTAITAGPATITATSENINGTATITVIVPTPAPGGSAPEPGGSDVILFQDNFDGYASTAAMLGGYNYRGHPTLIPGRSGNAVRFPYAAPPEDSQLLEQTFATTTDIYFRYWYRSSPGADPSCGGQNESGFKWFMAWRPNGEPRYTMAVTMLDGVPYQGRPNAGLEFTSHDNSSVLEPAQFLSNINHDIRFATTNEGNWHKYTLHIKVGTGGYEQIWIDDTLVLDNSGYGYDHSPTGIYSFQFPGTMVRWYDGCDFTLDVDDFVIWRK